jgi:hypothetical protein
MERAELLKELMQLIHERKLSVLYIQLAHECLKMRVELLHEGNFNSDASKYLSDEENILAACAEMFDLCENSFNPHPVFKIRRSIL